MTTTIKDERGIAGEMVAVACMYESSPGTMTLSVNVAAGYRMREGGKGTVIVEKIPATASGDTKEG